MPYWCYIAYSESATNIMLATPIPMIAEKLSTILAKAVNSLNHAPWKFVYDEQFSSRSEAMKREKEIKRKKSRKYIEWLINRG